MFAFIPVTPDWGRYGCVVSERRRGKRFTTAQRLFMARMRVTDALLA
jgi:hypothetical protein